MSTIPAIVQAYTKLWKIHLDAAASYTAHVDGLIAEEATVRENTVGSIFDEIEKPDIEGLHKGMIERVLTKAAAEFGVDGERAVIDPKVIESHPRFGISDFCPTALWMRLHEVYGAGQSHDETYRRVATALADRFHLDEGADIKTVGGGLSLEYSMWVESYGRVYSYSCREEAQKIIGRLRTFLSWADLNDEWMGRQFAEAREEICHMTEFERKKLPLGAHVSVTTYKSKLEFRLSPAASAKFQEFLAIYHFAGATQQAA